MIFVMISAVHRKTFPLIVAALVMAVLQPSFIRIALFLVTLYVVLALLRFAHRLFDAVRARSATSSLR